MTFAGAIQNIDSVPLAFIVFDENFKIYIMYVPNEKDLIKAKKRLYDKLKEGYKLKFLNAGKSRSGSEGK